MTFKVTGYKAYGVEGDEPLSSKCYQQFLTLNITAANTDVDMDLGDYLAGALGTFWSAANGDAIGADALRLLRQINARASSFHNYGGLSAYSGSAAPQLAVLTSAASVGGNATETLTFADMVNTDKVLALSLENNGANNVTLALASVGGETAPGAGTMSVTFSADPGAGAIVRALVLRAASPATAVAVSMANGTPNFMFSSGSAPTDIAITLCWNLQTGVAPINAVA
jgi:hypothetical protein